MLRREKLKKKERTVLISISVIDKLDPGDQQLKNVAAKILCSLAALCRQPGRQDSRSRWYRGPHLRVCVISNPYSTQLSQLIQLIFPFPCLMSGKRFFFLIDGRGEEGIHLGTLGPLKCQIIYILFTKKCSCVFCWILVLLVVFFTFFFRLVQDF